MNIERKTRAYVYGMERDGRISKGTISTYEGKDQEEKSKWSRWFARFVGDKAKKAAKIQDGEQIILKNAKIENVWDAKNKRAYYTVTIFDWIPYEPDEDEDEE